MVSLWLKAGWESQTKLRVLRDIWAGKQKEDVLNRASSFLIIELSSDD
jgi:hypothetical protein